MTTANKLTDMEFDEISLVSRPANQLSKVVLFKSDTNGEFMSSEEETLETEYDLANLDKGMGYGKTKTMKGKMEIDDEEEEEEEDMEKLGYGMKKGKKVRKDDSVVELPSEVYEYIEVLEATNAELQDAVSKMSEGDDLFDDEDILKSADPAIVELIKSAEARAEAAEEIAKSERAYRMEQEFISKAESLNALPVDAQEFGTALLEVAENVDAETFDYLSKVLEAANESISNGSLFQEVGKSTTRVDGPMDEVSKAASAVMQAHPNLTKEQAIAKAVEENPSLYDIYRRGE